MQAVALTAVWLVVVNVAIAANRDDPTVVGARITTCSGCRLNSLHEVRLFVQEEVRAYPAVEVSYVHGRDPVIEFLNRYHRVVKKEELAPLDRRLIHDLIQRHGIQRWTPKPTYEPFPFVATEYCVAWRQTGGCDPNGAREEILDEECSEVIDVGRSGYCECTAGRLPVRFDCAHRPVTCESECQASAEAKADL